MRFLRSSCVTTPAVIFVFFSLAGVASAAEPAAQPWWQLSSSAAPAHLQEGECEASREPEPQILPQCGQVVVRLENMGDLPVTGNNSPVSITDKLRTGWWRRGSRVPIPLRVIVKRLKTKRMVRWCARRCPRRAWKCTWSEPSKPPLPSYELLEVAIEVEVEAGAGGENEVEVSGGEGFKEGGPDGVAVAPVSLRRPVTVGGATPFGIEEYSLDNENEGGAPDTQAGSHPFQTTTNVALNQGTPIGPGDKK